MNESDFLDLWRRDRPLYQAWGEHVSATIERLVEEKVFPRRFDQFVKIPPKPRLKSDASLIDKAFYRKKQYDEPYDEIMDKVGVRFVVLLSRHISTVGEAITDWSEWTAVKDRDYEEERVRDPMHFDYQSVHYIVRASRPIDRNGVRIPVGIPCEVQVRTLLQHANSELTHETIYKRKIEVTPKARRAVAKSLALIEAADDYFELVMEEIEKATASNRTLSDDLAVTYKRRTTKEPEPTKAEGILVDAYSGEAEETPVAKIEALLDQKRYLCDKIGERASSQLLFRQPSILLVYLRAHEAPNATKQKWPLTSEELRPVYSDLGMNFDDY